MTLTVRGPGMSSAGLRASYASFEGSVSRMSSGLRITRAADDAAGLAISEGLRSRVSGSAVAVRNVHDGIGILQTAEGGLEAITSLLQRTRDLAVQAANGGSLDPAAREAIATETRQLVAEIDRTARATSSNGIRLLDGSRAGAFVFQVGAEVGDTLSVAGSDVKAQTLGLLGAAPVPTSTLAGTMEVPITRYTAVSQDFSTYSPTRGRTFSITVGGQVLADVPVAQGTYTPEQLASVLRAGMGADPAAEIRVVPGGAAGTSRLEFVAAAAHGGSTATIEVAVGGNNKLLFTTRSEQDTATVATNTVIPGTPGSSGLADLVTEGSAAAITMVDDALEIVLGERSRLGAVQNRMEHRLSILASSGENLAAARSRIADADMAQEYAGLVRAQLLTQVGTAMQAQGGQSAQRVLQLLAR